MTLRNKPGVIHVNRGEMFSGKYDVAGLIFHEMGHFVQGMHSLANFFTGETPVTAEDDIIYSCQAVCFEPSRATKCHCERCGPPNKFKRCGLECEDFKICHNPEKQQCKTYCPCNKQTYVSEILCAVNCPTGLACFTAVCTDKPNP